MRLMSACLDLVIVHVPLLCAALQHIFLDDAYTITPHLQQGSFRDKELGLIPHVCL